MHRDLLRLSRFLRKSPRFWKRVGLAALVLALIAGAAPSHGEPRALHFLFHGDQTRQMYFGFGLLFLTGFIVPVARMTSNFLRPWPWCSLFIAGVLWTHGKVLNVPHFILTNPVAGLLFGALVTLGPPLIGFLFIAQNPPKRSSKFGPRNRPSQDR